MDKRPLSVDQIAALMHKRGADGTLDALRMRVVRAINDGSLPGAYKVNPDRETSPWLVPADVVEKWLDADV